MESILGIVAKFSVKFAQVNSIEQCTALLDGLIDRLQAERARLAPIAESV